MATDNVTPITGETPEAPPLADQLMLTNDPEETPHRIACVLRFLANYEARQETTEPVDPDQDIEFGRYILLSDLATALDHVSQLLTSRLEPDEAKRLTEQGGAS